MNSTPPPELSHHFLEGLRLFDEQHYFDAHDALEELWFDEVGQVKLATQALIQLTVGLYHRKRGNLRGAGKLFRRCAEILEPLAGDVLTLDIRDLEQRSRQLATEIQQQSLYDSPVFDQTLVPDFREVRSRLEARRRQTG